MSNTLSPKADLQMASPSLADRTRKEEYFEILDETIRTNPYRKAATAMASVMTKHGITSDANKVLGKPAVGLSDKKCALTRALKLAQSCNQKLNVTKEQLQALCCDLDAVKTEKPSETQAVNSEHSDTTKVESPSEKAIMTGHLLTLIGEAQTIAKRIYETAVGLHVAEDYLRQPDDLKLLDFSCTGRIQIPNYNFNHASQLCLEWLHSTATKWLHGFKEDGRKENVQLIKVFENFTKAVKDYTEAVCLANQVFRVLLYPNSYGKETLQEYLKSLGHVLKNDIIMEVQTLRRAFDSTQYMFERLGWAASIAWMKHTGKKITVETLNETGIQVDHSVFHHKFYGGPSKLQGKNQTDINANRADAEISNPAKNTSPESKGTSEVGRLVSHEGTGDNLPLSRNPQSAPEVSKPKKAQAKKGKTRREDQKPQVVAVSEVPSKASLHRDDSNPKLGLLKLLKNDKGHSVPLSQSTMESANNEKKKVNLLTPAPNIPSALRKQFGAVFGAHLVPPTKAKVTRKAKKKTTKNYSIKASFTPIMNHLKFPSGSQSQELSPRSVESRKEVFKVLSETLRPPPIVNGEDGDGERKLSFPKINNTSFRKPAGAKQKSTLSFNSLKKEESLGHSPMQGPKSANRKKKNGRNNKGRGDTAEDLNEEGPVKDCHLKNVLNSAYRAMHELRQAKESLSDLVAEDEQLARGVRKSNPTEDHRQLAHVALSITNLCREAFIPAHRLNQTAIALYCAEDFLRYPSDIRTFNLQSAKRQIKLPDTTFNNATVMKLRQVVDLAAETYNKFNAKGRMGEELQEILFCILRGYQDFYAATLGCQEIFKVLLYTGPKDKAHLQQFLLALSAMDRSDLLVEIQDLRRILDEIVIFLEKLSWGSFVVYRLAGGSAGSENLSALYSDDQFIKKNQMSGIPAYPAYPLLKAKGPKLTVKKGVTEDSVEPSGIKLNMVHGGNSSYSMLSNEIKANSANAKQGNTMKKSKFSKKKNMNVGMTGNNDMPAGDANFPTYNKSNEAVINCGSIASFMRIDANGNRRSMINLDK